jgi:ankyrin repeat protein
MKPRVLVFLSLVACRGASDHLPSAAERGPTVVSAALARGASIEEKGAGGRTALHVAASRGDAELVALLVSRGADPDARDASGATPLQLAARRGSTPCIGLLARASKEIDAASGPKKRTALHDAVLTADAAAVRALFDAHAAIDTKDADGKTALHLVAESVASRIALVAPVLLEEGADATIRDAHGMTPVHLAAHADAVALLRLVPSFAFDVETPYGETPLDLALRYHRDAAAELLFVADAPTKRAARVPPLHEAARTDDIVRASALLGLGADPGRVSDGKTALEIARANGSKRVLALLAR